GEIFEMPADGAVTIAWNAAIARLLYSCVGPDFVIIPDKTLHVSETSAPKPDFYIYPAAVPLKDITAANVLLAIEVADTTMDHDLERKAPLYGKGGMREYWIVDCQQRRLLVFRPEKEGAFASPEVFGADDLVTARHIPGLSLRLSDLKLPK